MLETENKPNIEIREYWQIFLRRKYFAIIPAIFASTYILCIYCFVNEYIFTSTYFTNKYFLFFHFDKN